MSLLSAVARFFGGSTPAPQIEPEPASIRYANVPIEGRDPRDNSLLIQFNNLDEAAARGFDRDAICNVLDGKSKEYRRAVWEIGDEAPVEELARKPSTAPLIPRGARAVEGYDAAGNLIARFGSIGTAVAKSDFTAQGIKQSITSGCCHRGLQWRYATLPSAAVPAPEPPHAEPPRVKAPRFGQNRPRAVEAIDPKTGEVKKRYPSLSAVAGDGFQPTCVAQVLSGRLAQSGGYRWREVNAPEPKRATNRFRGMPIESFDRSSGRTLKKYSCISAAIRDGYSSGGIRIALQNGWLHHGLGWRYTDTTKYAPLTHPRPNRRPIESYDLTTGKTVHRYVGIVATADDGYQPGNVRNALRRKEGAYAGLGWRFVETAAETPAVDPAAEAVVQVTANKRIELARLNNDVKFVPTRNEYVVRLKNQRTLYRPTQAEAIALWYATPECERRDFEPGAPAEEVPATTPAIPAKATKEPNRPLAQGRRALEAFDPVTGEIRHKFNSIDEAQAQGFAPSCIYNVLRGKVSTHAELGWRYGAHQPAVTPTIEARCPTTGRVLFQFRTYDELKTKGYNPSRVTSAIKRKGVYKHLHWNYSDAWAVSLA